MNAMPGYDDVRKALSWFSSIACWIYAQLSRDAFVQR